MSSLVPDIDGEGIPPGTAFESDMLQEAREGLDLSAVFPDDITIRIPGEGISQIELSIGPQSRIAKVLKGAIFKRLELVIDTENHQNTVLRVVADTQEGSELELTTRRLPAVEEPIPPEVEEQIVEDVKKDLGLDGTPPPRSPMRCK